MKIKKLDELKFCNGGYIYLRNLGGVTSFYNHEKNRGNAEDGQEQGKS
jgi:hypothetical protein